MNNQLKVIYNEEMSQAKKLYQECRLDECFVHLERAHILGQSYVIPHTVSHWWMLKVGLKTKNMKEIFGQITRIFASIIFSRIWVPLGNTGGANVNPIKPMPIPKDLKQHLNLD